ncbi:MAG: hypothetical protein HY791_06540 [Deltaproteobacteria bacterium]|nr:hypothetical protein [Deltaproteobacteria bacterium]
MILSALLVSLTLSADEGPRLLTVVLAPPGREPAATPTQLIGALAEAGQGLRVYSPEQLGIDVAALRSCPAERRMSCLVGLSCPSGGCPADVLLIVHVPARDDVAPISAWWLTLTEGSRIAEGELPIDEKEARLFDLTARAEGPIGAPGSFAELLFQGLREHVRARALDRLGSVLLTSPAGLIVALDGRSLGLTGSETTISGLRTGSRRLEIGPRAVTVEVDADTPVVLDLSELEPTHELRPYVAPAGWVALGLGAAALTWAVIATAAGPTPVCLRRAAEMSATCPSSWVTSGAHALGGPTLTPSDVDSGGLPLAPTGLALSLTGATWVLLGGMGDPSEAPWLDFAFGLGAGVLTFSVATLALSVQ